MGNITDYVEEVGEDIGCWYIGTTNIVGAIESEHKEKDDATKHFKYWACAPKNKPTVLNKH